MNVAWCATLAKALDGTACGHGTFQKCFPRVLCPFFRQTKSPISNIFSCVDAFVSNTKIGKQQLKYCIICERHWSLGPVGCAVQSSNELTRCNKALGIVQQDHCRLPKALTLADIQAALWKKLFNRINLLSMGYPGCVLN